jgi:hypothetical protein
MCCFGKKGDEVARLRDAMLGDGPLPERVTSNGEFDAPGQTDAQRKVKALLGDMADRFGKAHGLSRRSFLKSSMGMAAAFLAMNSVYGKVFNVDEAQAADKDADLAWKKALADQLIFDDQVHFVHPEYTRTGLLALRMYTAANNNPAIRGEETTHEKIQFLNFLKEVYLDSDTNTALLSGAPAEEKKHWFLPNAMKADARQVVNGLAGSTRLLYQAVFAPGMPGWLDDMDAAIAMKPNSWKGYTVGDPQSISSFPYRLDDEKLVYPAYEKMVKAGITTVCIHKGLMPDDYKESHKHWRNATVDDLPKAAKDWPQITFVIYHAAIRPGAVVPDEHVDEVLRTGYIPWVSDLAAIPEKYGVKNVAADLGTVFGASAVMQPQHAAMILGTLIKGLGKENVYWGTDSVWHGSPQWQIEAFRRLEIPEDMRERFGFAPLGGPRSEVKEHILGLNAARHYGFDPVKLQQETAKDGLAAMRAEYEEGGRDERLAVALLGKGLGLA